MNSEGISADKFNQKMLQIAEVLKPLGVFIECEEKRNAEMDLCPKGVSITRLDVSLHFTEPVGENK